MTDKNDKHAPSSEFTAYLAREVSRSIRHEARFGSSRNTSPARRLGLIAASVAGTLVALSVGLVFGTSTGYASAQLELYRAQHSDSAPTSPPTLIRNVPMKRALAATCNALALTSPPASAAVDTVPQVIRTVDLPAAQSRTPQPVGAVMGVREVAGGKLLVNDSRNRLLRLFDSTLATSTVTQDSLSGPGRARPLSAFVGDSSLVVDPQAWTASVIDGRGRVARFIPLPDLPLNLAAPSATDNRGRILYTTRQDFATRPDSTTLVRFDPVSKRVDTLAHLQTGRSGKAYGFGVKLAGNPLMSIGGAANLAGDHDDWAVLADGSVAIVRGSDYHIDWIRPDGSTRSTGKLPFDWARLAEEEKKQAADSTRWRLRYQINNVTLDSAKGRKLTTLAPMYQRTDWVVGFGRSTGSNVLADLDGNLWILPTVTADSTSLTYDVVNARGDLVKRVRVGANRTIVGFGKGGVVYLLAGDAANGNFLERTRMQ